MPPKKQKVRQLYTDRDLFREKEIVDGHSHGVFRRDYARLIHSAAFRRLQGKTQLFPGAESDFFRNRLTHSLEVAQIAKSIALDLNKRENLDIDPDLVETAALAHDLGHPPFGHNGEAALDKCTKSFGGFEGNAQTLRILSRLEKKEKQTLNQTGISNGEDKRLGLNLTYRTLASILKYDKKIPPRAQNRKVPQKGYYASEDPLVRKIKEHIAGRSGISAFKTIECQIMDIADDIAYSTFDLEDAFKTGFLNPFEMLAKEKEFLVEVAKRARKNTGKRISRFNEDHVFEILHVVFGGITADFDIRESLSKIRVPANKKTTIWDNQIARDWAAKAFKQSSILCKVGYERTRFTSDLVDSAIKGVEFQYNSEHPALSKVSLTQDVRDTVEVLKHFVYLAVIQQSRLQHVESRGKDIVEFIFNKLDKDGGERFLPPDFYDIFKAFSSDPNQKKRLIADFVASMTDRYAIEFYNRLSSVNAESIFKEL